MAEFLVFPYLPARSAARVGDWSIVPFKALTLEHCADSDAFDLARGLTKLYHPEPDRIAGLGVFANAGDATIGAPVDRSRMGALRRAVLVAALDANPTRVEEDGEEEVNAGWKSCTSDNVVFYGHEIGPDGYTATNYGTLVTSLVGGLNVLYALGAESHDADETDELETRIPMQIHPPVELPKPMMYRGFDEDYAAALLELLEAGTDAARRLGRSIDWLDLAWRNTDSITHELRIVALRTGFEVLFDSDDTYTVRDAVSALLDPPDRAKCRRTWKARSGKDASADLTALAWWFQNFAFLRNKVVHGNPIDAEDFYWEGTLHLWRADAALRQSIKQMVIDAGHPDLALPADIRMFQRLAKEHGLDRPQDDPQTEAEDPTHEVPDG